MTVKFTTWSAICPSVFSESTLNFANCSGRMKRAATSSTTEDALEPKKRKVTYSTYKKWRHDFDRKCKTVTWLGCETEMAGGKRWVKRLNCTICKKYKERADQWEKELQWAVDLWCWFASNEQHQWPRPQRSIYFWCYNTEQYFTVHVKVGDRCT